MDLFTKSYWIKFNNLERLIPDEVKKQFNNAYYYFISTEYFQILFNRRCLSPFSLPSSDHMIPILIHPTAVGRCRVYYALALRCINARHQEKHDLSFYYL